MSSSWTRVLLAVVLCAGILLAWQLFFPQRGGESARPTGSAETEKKEKAKTGPEKPGSGAPGQTEAKPAPVATPSEGQLSTLTTSGVFAQFTTTSAALRSWKLRDERFKEQREGKLVPVDVVQTSTEKGPWPLSVTFPDSDFTAPEYSAFTKVAEGPREVRYVWQSDKVRVAKHFVMDATRPLVWMTLQVRNLTATALRHRVQVNLYALQDPGQGAAGFTNPYPMISTVMCHANGELFRRSAGAIRGSDSGCTAAGCGMGSGAVSRVGQIRWVGADSRYFLTALVPLDKDEQRGCELEVMKDDVVHAALRFSEGTLGPGASLERRFAVFVGAKDLASLDAVKAAGGEEARLAESIEYGNWMVVLCRPMLWLLRVFHAIFGNWGVAIILLTVVVKLLTLYWSQKSMRSMKQMQLLKPKMDALREKFKDDKERLNQELMALYKIHKVNPLGGCLPMVIQIPVWFALYRTLGNAVELYRSEFFGWITDLTAPDRFYVLPIAMGISMYAQQAITPQPMEGAQAKMMKYFMPGFFTLMMIALPSGLTLYIFVNTVLTMIHQWYMNKTEPKPDTPMAKAPTSEQPAGRNQRRKKRKGGRA